VIRQTEVDGIPTLIAPTAGPMRAGLVFRVGRADETLARGGITHLVEHLALHRHGLTDYHFNGATGATATHFHSQGTAEDLVSFLTGVCDGLADLPIERMETEKAILRTEGSSRSTAANELMPLWRHGARDYGLISFPEWGLHALRPDDLRQWAAAWFTRENAMLWIAGDDVPAGLRLNLPPGSRRAVPRPSSVLPATPAYFASRSSKVVWDAVVTRSVAASMYSAVLERELYRELRQEGGYSYTASTSYDPFGNGSAIVTAVADALPEKRGAALGGFVDVLTKLRVGRVEQDDLDAVRAKAEQSLRHPQAWAAMLPARAVDLLTGLPYESAEQVLAELRAVTIADVHRVATEAMASGLLMTPDGQCADWAGFTAAPTRSTAQVTGRQFVSRSRENVSVVVGPEGVSLVTPSGPVTVSYERCAAKLGWPDGARQLVGDDGNVLSIEPTIYPVDAAATAMIDAAVPESATIWMPARDPDAIPQPEPATTAASAHGGWLETTMLVLSTVAAVLVGLFGLILVAALAEDDTTAGGEWAFTVVVWILAILLALPAVLARLRRHARRAAPKP
jgi:predicted Zn-dependent peptidase